MSQSSIRLVKTPEIEKAMSFLRRRFRLLSEAEIIKLALSEMYKKESIEIFEEDDKVRKAYAHAMEEGHKIGERLMKEKGLDPHQVSEQEFFDLFLDHHKHNA